MKSINRSLKTILLCTGCVALATFGNEPLLAILVYFIGVTQGEVRDAA